MIWLVNLTTGEYLYVPCPHCTDVFLVPSIIMHVFERTIQMYVHVLILAL